MTAMPEWGTRIEAGRVVPDAAELAVADRICALAEQGAGIRSICRTLAAEGARSRTGVPLRLRTVSMILQRAGLHERQAMQPRKPRAPVQWTGGNKPTFGFRLDASGRLVPCEQEQAIVARILELRSQGTSMQGIADTLYAEGHRSRTGTPIRKLAVARVIYREQDRREAESRQEAETAPSSAGAGAGTSPAGFG